MNVTFLIINVNMSFILLQLKKSVRTALVTSNLLFTKKKKTGSDVRAQ